MKRWLLANLVLGFALTIPPVCLARKPTRGTKKP